MGIIIGSYDLNKTAYATSVIPPPESNMLTALQSLSDGKESAGVGNFSFGQLL
jgi:hypothetical protein